MPLPGSVRQRQLEETVHHLAYLMHWNYDPRVLGQHLRRLRERGTLESRQEVAWVQHMVTERVTLDRAYYYSLPEDDAHARGNGHTGADPR